MAWSLVPGPRPEDDCIHDLPHGDDRMWMVNSTQHLATKGTDPHNYTGEEENEDEDELEYREYAPRCCRCCWVIGEMLHHKKSGADVDYHADPAELPLPAWAVDMLLAGHLHSALALAIYFSPQQGGKENRKIPEVGTTMGVRGLEPYGVEEDEQVRYLGYIGTGMAAVAMWVGCDHSGAPLIYCNFNALIPSGMLPLYSTGWECTDPARWYGQSFNILSFTNEHLMTLWYDHGFRDTLFGDQGLIRQYPGARFIFSGYSHGSPMAQGSLLLFALECRQRQQQMNGYDIDWNGYRWVQADGKALMQQYLGDHQVHFTSVRRYGGYIHYDPTGGYPDNGCNAPGTYALDIDSSRIEAIEQTPDTSRTDALGLPLDWGAMHAIHIKAIRRLTAIYGEE